VGVLSLASAYPLSVVYLSAGRDAPYSIYFFAVAGVVLGAVGKRKNTKAGYSALMANAGMVCSALSPFVIGFFWNLVKEMMSR
jgi:hypothetical protein